MYKPLSAPRVHLIAIGGAVMHSLALALQQNGYQVSGSDDDIYSPARERLEAVGLLPERLGWNPDCIDKGLHAVILGMHARADNPELVRAQELGVRIFSFPEWIRHHAQRKMRIAIAGSHGKTTTTAMLMTILRHNGYDFDYLVGSSVQGFEQGVRLSKEAPFMLIEADEYLSSPIDLRPKFMHYQPHVLLLTGIAWDHANVFHSAEQYLQAFEQLLRNLAPHTYVFYHGHDPLVAHMVTSIASETPLVARPVRPITQRHQPDGTTAMRLNSSKNWYPMRIFGTHNAQNMALAVAAARQLGIPAEVSMQTLTQFEGAGRRLQTLHHQPGAQFTVITDFAHAPSKVQATVQAVACRYPTHTL